MIALFCEGCGCEHGPANMDAAGGPRCGCGQSSVFESGNCKECELISEPQRKRLAEQFDKLYNDLLAEGNTSKAAELLEILADWKRQKEHKSAGTA